MLSYNFKKTEDGELIYTPKKGSNEAIALFASQICNTPIAFLSVVNQKNEWFKASVGLSEHEESLLKDFSFPLNEKYYKTIEIEDVLNNTQFFNHPIVLNKNIVFFASVPIITPNGTNIGSLGVMDRKKRKLSQKQKKALIELSHQLMGASSDRLLKDILERKNLVIEKKNEAIEDFTNIAIENMTSPLNTITLLSEIINKNCSEELSLELCNYLNVIEASSTKMIDLIEEVKDFYDNVDLLSLPKEKFMLKDLLQSINPHGLEFSFEKFDGEKVLFANKFALKKIIESQIVYLIDLIKLSVHKINVMVKFQETKDKYFFYFKSNRAINKETLAKFTEEEENSFSSISQTLITSLGGEKTITLTNEDKTTSFYIAK